MDWLEKLEVRNAELHATIADEQLDIKNLTNQVLTIGQLQTEFDLQLKTGSNPAVGSSIIISSA